MDRLEPVIQHYAWGDTDYLASLQRRPPSGRPEAELWMGAYPGKSCLLVGDGRTLDEAIAADPVRTLGVAVAERFGRLPFLPKVLAAAEPLSIQVHPSLEQARAGFAREETAGLAPIDPTRVYPDDNHKPEIVCALTSFEAKCGFRSLADTRALFDQLGGTGLDEVRRRLAAPGTEAEVLADLLGWLLRLEATRAAALVDALVAACASAPTDHREADALRWTARLAAHHRGDAGVVVALLLHHVRLEPGEAMMLRAGVLHSYLEGSVVEIVAASDNVVRGGLTAKHVDVEELLAIVDCRPSAPTIQGTSDPVTVFRTDVDDLGLARIVLDGASTFEVFGPEVLIVVDGAIRITGADGTVLEVERGAPVWVPASTRAYELDGQALVFRATVGALG